MQRLLLRQRIPGVCSSLRGHLARLADEVTDVCIQLVNGDLTTVA